MILIQLLPTLMRRKHWLSIVSIADRPAMAAGSSLQNGTSVWELALVTAPSSYESSTAAIKLKAGGLDKLTLDGLCDEAIWRSNLSPGYNLWEISMLQILQCNNQHTTRFLPRTQSEHPWLSGWQP